MVSAMWMLICRKSLPGTWTSKCKGPEAGAYLCVSEREELGMAERVKEKQEVRRVRIWFS